MDEAVKLAKKETREYHLEYYLNHQLYRPGSWLAKPDRAVGWIIKMQHDDEERSVLDIGCGVGRNALPFAVDGYHVDCVDVLPEALELLRRNAILAGVRESINIWIDSAESVRIPAKNYDVILAVSVLEHCETQKSVDRVLHDIACGTKLGGAALITISTDRQVFDYNTGDPVQTLVETNLRADRVSEMLHRSFGSWQSFALETEPYEEKLQHRGRLVVWRSNEVRMLAVKGQRD